MSILDWFTSAPKVVDNVFDKEKGLLTQVGQWVGHQQFTEEEKAIHAKGMSEAIQAYSIATLGENTDRSKARRTIAVEWIRLQVWHPERIRHFCWTAKRKPGPIFLLGKAMYAC